MSKYLFILWDQWPESSMTLRLEEVCQVVVPVGHQTTAVFGRVHAAIGGQRSAISN